VVAIVVDVATVAVVAVSVLVAVLFDQRFGF